MDLRLRSVVVLLGLLVIGDVCSGAYRSSFRSYRSYSSYSSYRSFRSSGSGSVNTSGGGFIAGMVVMGVVIAVGIIILILCLLKKNGTICSSSTVTTNPSPTLDTINKGFIPTDNHNMGFINPPPPPTYSDVYPPPPYSNGNVLAPNPAHPPTATVFQ